MKFFISLAIANGCSKSEPVSSNLSAYLGSSLFFEINQKFLLFSFFVKLILSISGYLFSIMFLKSSTLRSVGMVNIFPHQSSFL